MTSTNPFIEVSNAEVEDAIKYTHEKFPLASLSALQVMTTANRTGERLHRGVVFMTARARSLKGNLAQATTPDTNAYKAYSRAVTRIFSNRRKAALAAKKEAAQARANHQPDSRF